MTTINKFINIKSGSIPRRWLGNLAVWYFLTALAPQPGFAATSTFDGGGSGGTSLDSAANWNPDGVPTTADEAVLDSSIFTLPSGLSTGSSQTFGDLIINAGSLTALTATGTPGKVITLSGGGGSAASISAGGATGDLLLLGTNVTGSVTIGGGAGGLGMALGANGNFNVVNATATANVTGAVTGAFILTKTGSGALNLSSASNNFAGLVIKSGTVANSTGGSANTLGSGEITLGDSSGVGNATLAVAGSTTIANDIVVQSGTSGTLTIQGASAGAGIQSPTFSGDISLNNNLTLNMNRANRTMFFSGTITGSGTINTNGTDTTSVVSITGGNGTSFTGDTTIRSNTLRFSNNALGNGVTGQGDGAITFLGNGVLQWGLGNTQDISKKTISSSGFNGTLDVGANDVTFATANGLTGSGAFTKAGSGTLTLSASNNYTGATTISAGALKAADGVGLPGVSTLQLRGGVFQSSGTFSRTVGTAAGNVNWGGSSGGGFAASGGILNVTLNGGTGSFTWNATNFVPTLQPLILSSSTSDNLVDFQNGINLGNSGTNTRTIVVNDNASAATDRAGISGAITQGGGTQSLLKNGLGILELTGANTYTGGTTINAGTLLVNGSHAGGGAYSVQAGATLGGSGSITGATNAGITLNSGAKLAPGASAGTLTASLSGTGALDISAAVAGANSGALVFELGAPGAGSSDLFSLTSGTMIIGAGELEFSDFNFMALAGFGANVYTLFDTNSDISGALGGNLNGTIGAFSGVISLADTNNDIILTVSPIPEPSTAALVVGGLWLIGAVAVRRR